MTGTPLTDTWPLPSLAIFSWAPLWLVRTWPFCKSGTYPVVPVTTWLLTILVAASFDELEPSATPAAAKAALEGMKKVDCGVLSRLFVKPAVETRELNVDWPVILAVLDSSCGTVKRPSVTWIRPDVNGWSALTTLTVLPRPEAICAVFADDEEPELAEVDFAAFGWETTTWFVGGLPPRLVVMLSNVRMTWPVGALRAPRAAGC
jgi:hypothetical protein